MSWLSPLLIQKSEEYIGRTPEEISANRMALIQNRLQDFVNSKGLGKMEMVRIPTANGVPQTIPRYKHFFPKDSVLLANDRQVDHFRVNERKEIGTFWIIAYLVYLIYHLVRLILLIK